MQKTVRARASGEGSFFFTEFTIRPAMHYREYDIHLASDPWDLVAAAAPSRAATSKTTGDLCSEKYPEVVVLFVFVGRAG